MTLEVSCMSFVKKERNGERERERERKNLDKKQNNKVALKYL